VKIVAWLNPKITPDEMVMWANCLTDKYYFTEADGTIVIARD
jgi:hypothetical protein